MWLRSSEHGTYLRADEDGHGVSLSDRRASMNAAWAVHRYYGDAPYVLLHSAAYGRYLAATTAWAPLGLRGFRVEQRSYDELEDESIRWQPIVVGPEAGILLRCAHDGDHYGYLRANGKYLRWNDDGVSVDDFYNISTMMQWVVVPIPSRERIPRIPRPTEVVMRNMTRLCSTKPILTVNGKFPGPALYAREGDNVLVKVVNHVPHNITIHGHGIRQIRTGWYDGPAYITRCPIQPGSSFLYNFTITGQRGTLLWHAHINWLRATVHGAIVILPKLGVPYPFPAPHKEAVVVLGEWWKADT